jgi:hypothetical protein
MHSGVKLIIGLVILLAGLYWYAAGMFSLPGFGPLGANAVNALKTVFFGTFGLFLIFLGLIIAWIEYEDIKWEAREKKSKKK